MKKRILVLFVILTIVFLIPPFVNYIVSIPSIFGYIPLNEKDTWIGFYGSVIGGSLTLLGVWWTISYTESTWKKDQENHKKEQEKEFISRNEIIKRNFSAQYKPILDITCHPDLITTVDDFSLSKNENMYIQNILHLNDEKMPKQDEKRLNVILTINNIGRGEANVYISIQQF